MASILINAFVMHCIIRLSSQWKSGLKEVSRPPICTILMEVQYNYIDTPNIFTEVHFSENYLD